MAKAELKTKVNDASVTKFLNSVVDERKRKDCFELIKMMKQITKEEPKIRKKWAARPRRCWRSWHRACGCC